MVVLSRINQLKSQGASTAQIIQTLKEEGYSPRDINEALSQSEIKREVNNQRQFAQQPTQQFSSSEFPAPSQQQPYQPQQYQNQYPQQYQQYPQNSSFNDMSGMQPSIETQDYQEVNPPNPESEIPFQQPETMQPQQYAPEQQTQQYYPEYSQQSTDFETISDITTQIIEEKMDSMKKEIDSLTKFKKHTRDDIESINKKLEKIENTLDQLQLAIIRKVGEYGENIKNLSEEMQATQDSFAKIINPLTENLKELRKISGIKEPEQILSEEPTTEKPEKSKDKSKSKFEDYLR